MNDTVVKMLQGTSDCLLRCWKMSAAADVMIEKAVPFERK